MIYKLTSFSGESEVVGQLREFAFEGDKLTIKGLTIQDAHRILSALAALHDSVPLSYTVAAQDIVNAGVAAAKESLPVKRSVITAEEVAAIPPGKIVAITTGKDLLKVAEKAKEPVGKIPEEELRAAEVGKSVAEAKEETKEKKPAALRTRQSEAPAAVDTSKIQKIADGVAKEVAGTPVKPEPKPEPKPAAEPAPAAAEEYLLDIDNLPTWLTSAGTMRVMLNGFLQNLQLQDFESIYRECIRLQHKVPFIAKERFKERLAAGIEQLYGE